MSTQRPPVVFITGASRGIGAACAQAFARAGWRIAISARTQRAGETHTHQLRRPDGATLSGSLSDTCGAVKALGAECLAVYMDLMEPDSLDAAAAAVLARFGRVDLLINNAVYQDRESNALLSQLSDEALSRTLQGNVLAPTRLVRRLLPAMVAQGGGQIINVCSGAGRHDPPLRADQGGWGFAYGASKAALGRLAGMINREYGPSGLRAFSVNPGLVSTEAVSATLGDDGELARRYGAMPPQAIAAAMLWLATAPEAAELVGSAQMLELQDLVRRHGLG